VTATKKRPAPDNARRVSPHRSCYRGITFPEDRAASRRPAPDPLKGTMNERTNTKDLMPSELASELRALVAEAEKILRDERSATSHNAVAALRDRFEAAQEQLGNLYTETRQKVTAGAKYADHTIREHPYQALAVAVGAGVLLGWVIGRRPNT